MKQDESEAGEDDNYESEAEEDDNLFLHFDSYNKPRGTM